MAFGRELAGDTGTTPARSPLLPGMSPMAPGGAQMGTGGLLGVLSFAPSSLGLWWGCFSVCVGLAQLREGH